MKALTTFLAFYFSLLVVQPLVCDLYVALKSVDICCSTTSCEKEESAPTNKNKQGETTCCIIQNCHCYFIVSTKFEFKQLPVATSDKIRPLNDKVISNYLADCWHPPEMG